MFYLSNVYDLLESFSKEKPDFIFIENDIEKYTIKEFFNTVIDTANHLYNMGVDKNDMVVILAKKDIETIIYFFACQILGAMAFMVDSSLDIDEYKKSIKYIVYDNRKVYKQNNIVKPQFDYLKDSRKTTILISTSGSTGKRKIVKLSQFAFINNSFDSNEFGFYEEKDVALAFLPLNHVFAIAMLFTAVCFKFKVVVARSKEIKDLLMYIDKYHVTRFNGIPSIFLKMCELKDNYNISSLKCAYIGGAPCSTNDYLKIEEELNIKLISVYGMSECIGISTGSFYDSSDKLKDSVGKVYPLNDLKLDLDCEILVKSPTLCNGYLNGELELKDGYLKTGDIGEFDEDGFLHIVGRKKEIIIRNGINISIFDVTEKINNLNLFKDFVVVGIKDKDLGEALGLALVLDKYLSEDDILNHLSKYLKPYEMPKKIIFLDTIPLLLNGKTDKEKIKKLFI